MSTKSVVRRRTNLFKKDPHCFWCGCEVIYFSLAIGQKVPNNFATLDHLNDRTVGDRPDLGQIETTVLSCQKCNNSRASKKVDSLPREFLWSKSGRYPLGYKKQ